ncbi:MAG: cytochrome c oxidase subunit II [Ignavibacteriales bacterium]
MASGFSLFPERASTVAGRIDTFFHFMVVLCAFVALLVIVLIFYFCIKYRRGSNADRSRLLINNYKLESAWTIIPLGIFIFIFIWGANLFFTMYQPPPGAIEIYVVGKQWMWKIQHPEGQREIDELHVPMGRPVKLTMTSQDVIHDFFIPAFRVKQDVLPGRYTSLWFEATKPGEYHLFCSQYCGTNHSLMVGRVIVMRPVDYEKWLKTGTINESLASAGQRLFQQFGCSGCHGPNSSVHAPKLEGVFGKPVHLQGGETVIADEKYIRDSILLPESQVVAGYVPIMPSFKSQINEEQLLQIIAYIKSLGEKPQE